MRVRKIIADNLEVLTGKKKKTEKDAAKESTPRAEVNLKVLSQRTHLKKSPNLIKEAQIGSDCRKIFVSRHC